MIGAARRGEIVLHRAQFVLDDVLDAGARAQDIEVVGNFGGELIQLVGDLVAAERRQALQAQIEDGAGLFVGQPVGAALGDTVARIVDQGDQRLRHRPPASARHQGFARCRWVVRAADQRDDFVDVGDRDGEAHQHVGAVARLVEQELRAPGDHLLAERDEGLQHVVQRHHSRPAAIERDHVGAEGRSAAA